MAKMPQKLTGLAGVRGATLVVVPVVLLALWFVGWHLFGGRYQVLGYSSSALANFSPYEAGFYATAFAVQLAILISLTIALSRKWPSSWDDKLRDLMARPRLAAAAFALLGVAAAAIVLQSATRLHTLTEDEKTYLFQAKLLTMGKLSIKVFPEGKAFWESFMVGKPGQWSGQYFWGPALLLVPGVLIGCPWVIPLLLLGVTVYATAEAAREYSGDVRVGLATAALIATSPLVILTGATLHNANLSATCISVALWSLVVLTKRKSWPAQIALGVSVGLATHTRPLEILVVSMGAAVILLIRERGQLGRVLRLLWPSILIALPLLALHPLINHAVSGDWRHSGYWLVNEGHGFKTMGFGLGPFGDPHTPGIAASKTLTVMVRIGFYAMGGPLLFGLLLGLLLGAGKDKKRLWAPAIPIGLYAVGYFLYAGSSVHTTGPVYYVASMPLLLGWIALLAVHVHDELRTALPHLRRAVPAIMLGQWVAALIVFWPTAWGELAHAGRDAGACVDLAHEHKLHNALVFVNPHGGAAQAASWTFWPPLPSPTFDDDVLFPRHESSAKDLAVVARYGAGRGVYAANCIRAWDWDRWLKNYDPATGVVTPLEELKESPGSDQ